MSGTTSATGRPIKTWKKFKRAVRLSRAGDPVGAVRWLYSSLRGSWTPVQVNIHGHRVALRAPSNDISIALTTLSGEFNELRPHVPALNYGLIIDAGGYLGTAAIALADAYPQATVITLEPSFENFELLVRNTAAYPNIIALNKAIASEPGSIELKDRGRGFSGLTIVDLPNDNPDSPMIGSVECVTVENILEQFGFAGIDIFKIDIEGAEYQLLSHNLGWLERTTAICIELHDRIVMGCSEAWANATVGRLNSKLSGEKYLSVAAQVRPGKQL